MGAIVKDGEKIIRTETTGEALPRTAKEIQKWMEYNVDQHTITAEEKDAITTALADYRTAVANTLRFSRKVDKYLATAPQPAIVAESGVRLPD